MESAAATRQALIEAAAALLDSGGPDAVTLRDVGARAGVSRSAPYRHFAGKEQLLTEIASEAWRAIGDRLQHLAESGAAPEEALRRSLRALIETGRARPHLYRLMFAKPESDPDAVVRAAGRAHDLFVDIVAGVGGPESARRHAALLFTSTHGAADLELSGHLVWDKWHATAEDLVESLIALLPRARR